MLTLGLSDDREEKTLCHRRSSSGVAIPPETEKIGK